MAHHDYPLDLPTKIIHIEQIQNHLTTDLSALETAHQQESRKMSEAIIELRAHLGRVQESQAAIRWMLGVLIALMSAVAALGMMLLRIDKG